MKNKEKLQCLQHELTNEGLKELIRLKNKITGEKCTCKKCQKLGRGKNE